MSRDNYDKEQLEFALFQTLTKEDKLKHFGYTTQRDFAKAHLLPHEKILSEWKRQSKFKKLQQDMFIDSFKDLLPEAKKSLATRGIQDGDVSALKEIFKLAGLSIDRVENISKNDIQAVVQSIVEIINKYVKDPEILGQIAKDLEELDL